MCTTTEASKFLFWEHINEIFVEVHPLSLLRISWMPWRSVPVYAVPVRFFMYSSSFRWHVPWRMCAFMCPDSCCASMRHYDSRSAPSVRCLYSEFFLHVFLLGYIWRCQGKGRYIREHIVGWTKDPRKKTIMDRHMYCTVTPFHVTQIFINGNLWIYIECAIISSLRHSNPRLENKQNKCFTILQFGILVFGN